MKKYLVMSLFAIVIPLILFGVIGCMKKPDHTPNYGPEVSTEQILSVLQEMPVDAAAIKAGQHVSIDITQVIDTQTPQTLFQRLDKVTARRETDSIIELDFEVTTNSLEDGIWKQSIDAPTVTVTKETEASTSNAKSNSIRPQKIAPMSVKAMKAADEQSPLKVTYHNLKREDGFTAVPISVMNQPDCGGITNCERGLRYLRLSFDRVIWETGDRGIKTSFRITYSPDIPPFVVDWADPYGLELSQQLQTCVQTWMSITSGNITQEVPVQQCTDVRDFQL